MKAPEPEPEGEQVLRNWVVAELMGITQPPGSEEDEEDEVREEGEEK